MLNKNYIEISLLNFTIVKKDFYLSFTGVLVTSEEVVYKVNNAWQEI